MFPCWTLEMTNETFDSITPPALPPDWIAANAQGPPPLWGTSNSGVPMPPADSPPNAVFIDDPGVTSDKRPRLATVQFFRERSYNARLSGTISILKHPTQILAWVSTAACWSSALTAELPFKIFLRLAAVFLSGAITAPSVRIVVVRLQVVGLGAATRKVLSRRW